MMNLFEAMETRRSVRKYTREPVPRPVIEKALHAALLAPNTSNLQPWEMYWVTNPEKKAQLVKACLSQSSAATAAELVVFVARTDTWRRNRELVLETLNQGGSPPQPMVDYYKKIVPLFYAHGWWDALGLLKSILFPIVGLFRPVPRGPFSTPALKATLSKTVALASENFMLAITAQGYSTCPMEGFDEWRVKKILGLGGSSTIVMVISVGKEDPAGIYGPRIRLDPSLFLFEV
jgi:nitroreductase